MRILLVDDDELALTVLGRALAHTHYQVDTACNGREALQKVRSGQYKIVVSDWEMPEMNGIQLCQAIRERRFSSYIYVMLLTSRNQVADVVEGISAGADDFLMKPIHPSELRVRLRSAERLLGLESRDAIIFALAKLAESRDPDTGVHLERMREYARVIADYLCRNNIFADELDGDYVQMIYLASPLHDIGKVGVPDNILLKPGRLERDEFELMKRHTLIGAETLKTAMRRGYSTKFLQVAYDLTRSHHEHFDGSGYPDGLVGEQIPLCARIVALADVYDALTTDRVYRSALSHEEARNMIFSESGTHFDPRIVAAFKATEMDFLAIKHRFAEEVEKRNGQFSASW